MDIGSTIAAIKHKKEPKLADVNEASRDRRRCEVEDSSSWRPQGTRVNDPEHCSLQGSSERDRNLQQ